MFSFGIFGGAGVGGAEALILLVLALILEAVIGTAPALFRNIPHPIAALGQLIALFDERLNRESRSEAARLIRGLVVVVVVILVAITAAWVVLFLAGALPFGWVLEVLAIAVLVAQRGLFDHVKAVRQALGEGGVEAGRQAVRHIVGRDPESLDEHGVARAAIESCAENFNDGVVAPVFWYILLGLPGLMIYKAVNTMDSMIGHTSARYRAFGMAAAKLDDALSYIPARISAALIAMAALFVPTADAKGAIAVIKRDAAKHRSPNAGWPEAAMAGALDLALAGPRRYGDEAANDPWIGDGRAQANRQDIRRALYLYAVSCLINAGLITALILAMLTG